MYIDRECIKLTSRVTLETLSVCTDTENDREAKPAFPVAGEDWLVCIEAGANTEDLHRHSPVCTILSIFRLFLRFASTSRINSYIFPPQYDGRHLEYLFDRDWSK